MARRTGFTLSLVLLLLAGAGAVAIAQSTTTTGTDAGDQIGGTDGADRLGGGGGDDLIVGQGGDDAISGGTGQDRLDGGAGVDTISGDAGNDRVRGGADRDFITGDAGDDELDGEQGSNVIDGGQGNDFIRGGDRVDSLNGGADDDRIFGGGGDDGITGASGRDHLFGGDGDDRIDGGLGQDLISGGDGGDNIVSIDGQPDRVRCGRGRDVVRADGGDDVARDCEQVIEREGRFDKRPGTKQQPAQDLSGFPTQSGAFDADRLVGGRSNDVITGGGGDDSIAGGAERDFLEGGPDGDTIDGEAGSNIVNGAIGNDHITGGDKADSLNGGSDEDVIFGGDGDDGITGASGRDELHGGDGDDRIEGGLGKDRIFGEGGDDNIVAADGQQDEIRCGAGDDVVRADGDDKVDDDCELLIARRGSRYVEIPVQERLPAVGLGDTKASTFGSELFQALPVRRMRFVTPWNVVRTDPGRADVWLQAARRQEIEPLVSFNHGDGAECPDDPCRAPSVSAYRAAFREFHRRYPWVTMISPWNEANHQTQPIAKNPKRAAQYYNVVREECRGCTIVAVDVLDQKNMRDYVEDFLRFADGRPKVFGIHNYDDVNRTNSTGTRELIDILEDGARRRLNARDFETWFLETGGIVKFVTSEGRTIFRHDEDRAADRLRFMYRLISRFRERVRQVYVYNWSAFRTDRFDSGLVDPDGTRRESYDVFRSRDDFIR